MKRYPNRKFRSQPLQIICLSPNSPSSRFLKSLMHTTYPAPIQMRSMLPSIHILHPRTPNMRHLRELPHTLESPRLLLRHRLTTHDSAGHIHTTHSLHLLYLLHMELLLRLLLLLLHNHAKTHFLSFCLIIMSSRGGILAGSPPYCCMSISIAFCVCWRRWFCCAWFCTGLNCCWGYGCG